MQAVSRLFGRSNTKLLADELKNLRDNYLDPKIQPSQYREAIQSFFAEPAHLLPADKVIKFISKYFNNVRFYVSSHFLNRWRFVAIFSV